MAGDIGSLGYLDRVYFDSVTGVAGIEWPVGTAQLPSDVIADVITMLAARNLHKIEIHGGLTLAATMNHYCFFGHEHEAAGDILNLGSQDVDDSYFESLIITGIQGGAGLATYRKCMFVSTLPIPMSGFRGMAKECSIFGGLGITLATGNADYADFDHCTSVHGIAQVIIGSPDRVSFKDFSGGLILTVQAAGDVFVRGISGYLEIDEMTGGTLEIYAHGADIVINADCTGGTIAIYGDARVTDNSAGGCVVTDSTKETQLDDIEAAIASLAGGAFYGSYGPRNVEVDNDVDFGIMLYDPSSNIITTGEITPGTYTVRRVRGAVDTEIVAAAASSEAAGRVYMTYAFPAASWNVGDIFYITFIGIVVTLAGVVTEYPNLFIWGRVVREPDLSSKIDDIEAKLDAGAPRVYVEQIPDTDFALAAIDNALTLNPPSADAENSVVDIDQVANSTFVLRSLWVNVTSLGTAGTKLTFGLWVLLNTVVTQVDSVDVAALGIQNLMDLFGLQEVHADGIWITVLTDSGSADAACSGTYRYAEAKI